MKTIQSSVCLLLALLIPQFASALIVGPYTTDTNTLHLWHLNEATAPAVDVGNSPTNLIALAADATLNNVSFTGFGTALSTLDQGQNAFGTTNSDAVLSIAGNGTNGAIVLANPTTAAFTMEAIVHIDFDPTKNLGSTANGGNNRNAQCMIMTAEGNANANRLFQFRIDPVGVAVGSANIITNQPALEFINLHLASGVQNMFVLIPTNGPDAIVSNGWYHVAVTYNGSPNTPNNLLFYWTLVDATRSTASLIGGAQMVNNLSTGVTVFTLGNTGRNPSGTAANPIINNFLGRIDEVRISNIARGAGQMLFASALVSLSQQPVVQEGVDYGGTVSLSVGATSLLPLAYQWRLNSTPIAGATNATYVFTNATLANAGNYTCVITNSNPSSATSSVAVVSIGAANFLAHRYGFTNDVTDSFGTASGTLFGNANVSGGALQLDGTTGTYLGLPGGLVTNQAAITVESWASFTTIANNSFFFGLGDTNGANGRYYIFCTPHGTAARIAITGADPGYNAEQIANCGAALDNRTGVQIVSVFAPYLGYEALYTNGVLAVINTNVTTQLSSVVDNYSFIGRSLYSGDPYLTGSVDEFRIYNGALSASSIAQSYLQGPDNALSDGPVQTVTSPTNTTVAQGQSVTFTSVAQGRQPILYQWLKNGTPIAGATNRTYTYSPTFADNGKQFTVLATNTVAPTTFNAASSPATLTVLVPETLAWLGATDNGWNLSSQNWSNSLSQLVAYAQFDGAVFDDRGAGQPTVDLQFAVAPVAVTVSNSAADYVISSASANGSLGVIGTLLKQGSGRLTIDVTNNSTGVTVVQNGTLQVGNGDASGSLGSGDVTNNATLSLNRGDAALVVGNLIHGTGVVSFDGGGSVTITGTNDYTGATVINSGVENLQNTFGLGATNGGTTVASGGQLYINANVDIGAEPLALNGAGGDGNGALRKGGAGATTYSGAVTLGSDSTIGVDGSATLTLNNPLGLSGGFALTKNGNGVLALNTRGTYTGGTTLAAGILNLNTNQAVGVGDITVNAGRIVVGPGVNLTNTVNANTVAPGAATGLLMMADTTNGSIATVSGPVTFAANAASGGHFYGPFTSGYLNVLSFVNFGGTFMVVRDGRVRFAGGGNYPEIQVRANTTSLGATNGVATTAVMDTAGNGTAFFDLNGFDQKLGGLKNTVTPGNAALGFVTNSSAVLKTLTLDLAGNAYTYGGSVVGNLALVLNSGTQTFTGGNHYTGNTTVNGGTLELATSLLIATNTTVSIASGATLQLDYADTNRIGALLLNGVNQAPGVYNATTSPTFITGTGNLLVAIPVATNRTNIVVTVSGNNLILSWPADHIGWRLQAQTNALTSGLGSNWVDVPNSTTVNTVTNVINPANGAVFYRLAY